MREDNAKRQHDNAAAHLRTCGDHRCTMDALLAPDGVPPDFLAAPANSEAASLAAQPWYRVLYIAQVRGPLAALAVCKVLTHASFPRPDPQLNTCCHKLRADVPDAEGQGRVMPAFFRPGSRSFLLWSWQVWAQRV